MFFGERAWIACTTPVPKYPLAEGTQVKLKTQVRNAGRTPGVIVRQLTYVFLELEQEPLIAKRIEFAASQLEYAPAVEDVIAPDAVIAYHTEVEENLLTEVNVARMNFGTAGLFVVVRFRYRDVSGQFHITQECYKYDYWDKAFVGLNKWNQNGLVDSR